MNDRPTPAMWEHIVKVYKEMDDRAHDELVEADAIYEPKPTRVYEGHLTTLFSDLQIPNPYYTSIMDALKKMNCVEQLRRGGGAAKSKWLLLLPPTEEGFLAYDGNRLPKRAAGKVAALEQRLKLLTDRVEHIEKFLERSNSEQGNEEQEAAPVPLS